MPSSCFLIGAVLPIPLYFLARRYPHSWFKYVNVPVVFTGKHRLAPCPGEVLPISVDRYWEFAARKRDQLFVLGDGWVHIPSASIGRTSDLNTDSLP